MGPRCPNSTDAVQRVVPLIPGNQVMIKKRPTCDKNSMICDENRNGLSKQVATQKFRSKNKQRTEKNVNSEQNR